MGYKFKPQTGILVAGLLAATYAEACWYEGTSVLCVASGSTVDKIRWSTTGTDLNVTASADWLVTSQPGYHIVTSGTGAGGYQGYNGDGGSIPDYCTGPVHFTDAAGNTASVAGWSRGSTDK